MYSKEAGKKHILFYCGHPAHFHLLKNPAARLLEMGNEITFAIKAKDVLENLLKSSGFRYYKISGKESSNRFIKYLDAFLRLFKYAYIIKKTRAFLLVGTSWENSRLGKILNIPSICLNEDDAEVVPLFVNNAYPNATAILLPECCSSGKYRNKVIAYNSLHELAYLHPKYFTPDFNKVKNLITHPDEKYFIIRLAKLKAHHDIGKKGIDREIVQKIIEKLSPYGRIYITTERELGPEFEQYRIKINPLEIHHAMAFATMYIGDSQTMAAEAAVLGVPSIRFNDFVGKLGYLEELEHKYGLTYGIQTSEPDKLFQKIDELLMMPDLKEEWQRRRYRILNDKIDVTTFLVWFIENYPDSVKIMKENPDYQYQFK
ncbi:DUF354 domain-containing protein [Melioribacter sp. Ez-97]|uniref:DUF354 domain-containing protein n=1 Tax=Melioribacter sp. Ez-97 TaxID=3423434 RepID=UPI003EDACFE5